MSQTQQIIDSLASLSSESRNLNTMHLDTLSTLELVSVINEEDKKVPLAVQAAIPDIVKAVDLITQQINEGGRLIYIGAGTSGRLGILDAIECPPTFSVDASQVIGILAGGSNAMVNAVEGAEDSTQLAPIDLQNIALNSKDVVVGIAASGRTPYVISALEYAQSLECNTVSLCCNAQSPIGNMATVNICVEPGPECLTGSTRMKAGTAQKLVLNTLSTSVFVKLGKVFENLMVDVSATNEKLKARAARIVMQATQCTSKAAMMALQNTQFNVKASILMVLLDIDASDAIAKIDAHAGYLREAISS